MMDVSGAVVCEPGVLVASGTVVNRIGSRAVEVLNPVAGVAIPGIPVWRVLSFI